ncbi:MAG: FAD-dependent oxidoreductase [Phycisphaeraceae bacterium]
MIQKVIVLGGGSAGFMAAIALKAKIPALEVLVIRSKEIGIIGVGEGSTTGLTRFLHNFLAVHPKKFFDQAQPIWKLGLKFLWGPRRSFNYTFGPGLDSLVTPMSKRLAYYCDADEAMDNAEVFAAMMARDRVFLRDRRGAMHMHSSFAYHFENEKFVAYLEQYAGVVGVKMLDDTVRQVTQDDSGITGLNLASGSTQAADLYVDCSGFASVLLSKTLGEPYDSFRSTLFCDRAVIGGWDRGDEPIKPYTTCETMNSGWAWQIEHEHRINRGYVYCSSFISDEEAEREFRAANPKVGPTRVVPFLTGCYRRNWVNNVVAIGNASGFVEPLEATALSVIATQARMLVGTLIDADREIRPLHTAYFSDMNRRLWESIRSFIAIHYKFNTRLDTPFWRECREKTDMASAQAYVDFYLENGPSGYWQQLQLETFDQFGAAGYIALLVGMKVPHRASFRASEGEKKMWGQYAGDNQQVASDAFDVRQALAAVRSSKWEWPGHMMGQ